MVSQLTNSPINPPTNPSTKLYSLGEKLGQFQVTKSQVISELQCVLTELTHLPTGASVVHVGNKDPENLFCLSFQTLPKSDNGVAHILEHVVLTGSKKYPVRDPFFSMQRRSLNTFMNALTGSDFTCYPAASLIKKDFYNLLEVYLDAAFSPNLDHLNFLQEGHRLEFSDPVDASSKLLFKGVVYNEMKGALASPYERLSEATRQNLFPETLYGYNSGGDPKAILSLTEEELQQFHSEYYHPSRCLFFFCGDMPLEDHLDFIEKNALKGVKPQPPLPEIPKQPRFKEPVRSQIFYPFSQEGKVADNTYIQFSWLVCPVLEQEKVLALLTLQIILMGTDASPLKRKLLESKLCSTVSMYFDTSINEVPCVMTFKGCLAEKAEDLEKELFRLLKEMTTTQISMEDIEMAIHQLEFEKSEMTSDYGPFGLMLYYRTGLLFHHGGNVEEGLVMHSLFDQLREHCKKDAFYLTNILKEALVENSHFVRMAAVPDKELSKKEQKDEDTRLEEVTNQLSEEDKQQLVKQAQTLLDHQEMEENLDILPKLHLNDVPKEIDEYPLQRSQVNNLEVFYHDSFTNGICYADLVYPLPKMEKEDVTLLSLFINLVPHMGCGGRDYIKNLEYIQNNIGDIYLSLQAMPHVDNPELYAPILHVTGKALNRKSKELFKLIIDIVTSVDFSNKERVKEMINRSYVSLQGGLVGKSLKFAKKLSYSSCSGLGELLNAWEGLEYYYLLQDLTKNYEKREADLLKKFEEFKDQVFCLKGAHLVLTCEEKAFDKLKKENFYGLPDLEAKEFQPWEYFKRPSKKENQGKVVASPVAFTAQVVPTVPYSHPLVAAINVGSIILENVILHSKIREKGGAYGSGAPVNVTCGYLSFYSYRDPHICNTLQTFNDSLQIISDGEFTEEHLEEAKFGVLQAINSPISPEYKARLSYHWFLEGKTTEMRQALKDQVFAVTKKDVQQAMEQMLKKNMQEGCVVTFAEEALLKKENEKLKEEGKEPLVIQTL